MDVQCTNCGGLFDDSEPKCPYCGMIYEPGAEKDYNKKLEKIRTNLDNIDELAAVNFKKELKQFFITFAISLVAVLLLVLLIVFGRIRKQSREQEKTFTQMHIKLNKISEFNDLSAEWNRLYDENNYNEMYLKIVADIEENNLPSSEITNWCHYQFYSSYLNYLNAKETLNTANEGLPITELYFTDAIWYTFKLYSDLFSNPYVTFTSAEKEALTAYYEDLKADLMTKCNLSQEDYDSIRDRLIIGNSTYISLMTCSEIAKERFGD